MKTKTIVKTENKWLPTVVLAVLLMLPMLSFAQQGDPATEAKIKQRDLQLQNEINERLGKLDKSDPAYKTKLEIAERLHREQKTNVEAQNIADRLAAKKANPQLYPNIKQGLQRNEQGIQYGQLPPNADRKEVQYGQLPPNADPRSQYGPAPKRLKYGQLPPEEGNQNQGQNIPASKRLQYVQLPPEEGNQNQGQNRALLSNQGNGQNKLQGNNQTAYAPISAPKEKVPSEKLSANAQQDPKKVEYTEKQSRIIAEGRQDLKGIEKNRQEKFQNEVSGSNKLLAQKQARERELLQSKQDRQKRELEQNQDNKKSQKLKKVENERAKAIANSKDGKLSDKQKLAFDLKGIKVEQEMKKETEKKLAAQKKVNERPKQELQKRQLAEDKKSIKSNKTKANKINSSSKKEAKPIKKKITKTIKSATKASKKATKKVAPKKKSKK